MAEAQKDSAKFREAFRAAEREHILMITNHGIHEWKMTVGLPDTGGQNVFVNMFTDTLVALGYKVTIVNRGGYEHPTSGEWRGGVSYKNEHQRILYLEDGDRRFIRKEDMLKQIPALTDSLEKALREDGLSVDFIVSHYWDAAQLGILLNRRLPQRVPHVWVPHSLGSVKKRNVQPEQWDEIRVDERIGVEKTLFAELDAVAATSGTIRGALIDDYGFQGKLLFLPPCVDPERYFPRELAADDPTWEFLARHSGCSAEEIRNSRIITEVSRTDSTKRKDVVVKAFNKVAAKRSDLFLALTLDETREALAQPIHELIQRGPAPKRVALLGSVWDRLPKLYAITDIYITPSVMEGFGMSIQEAAATAAPAVSSDLVPFATEFLAGERAEPMDAGGAKIRRGEGALIVAADDVDGFAGALDYLLSHEEERARMGRRALEITVPKFTWKHMVAQFLAEMGRQA